MSLLHSMLAILLIVRASSLSSSAINGTLRGIPEDGVLDFLQMAAKYKHPAEEHQVTTEDGYILKLFHIKGDKRRPVLLNHGVFDSADGWILRGKTSLAIMLAEEGYDVWFLNQRGNRYSREHVTLNPDTDADFWDYSSQELGYYDMPANIDYVLNATGQAQLTMIGFSQGTTMGYVLGATRPEYNAKIKAFLCLAPIAFLQNTVGPLRVFILLGQFLNGIIPWFINEMGGYYSISKVFVNLICTQLGIGYDFCFETLINPLIGPNIGTIEESFFKIIIGHFPAGTSKKNLIHYSQIGTRGAFADYDYGTVKNMEVYGSFVPPAYDLSKVTIPVHLFSASNDRVSTLDDVRILQNKLPNVVEWKILDDLLYNHLDHLWAIDANKVVHKFVLKSLAKYH